MKLSKIFDKYKEHPFKFIRPGGNAGDYLIYAGAEKLANETRISYKSILHPWKRISCKLLCHLVQAPSGYHRFLFNYLNFKLDDIIYIHGGGAFNSIFSTTAYLLRIIVTKYPENIIIVGPSTTSLEIEFFKKLLPKDNGNIIFFARELTTYKFIMDNFYSNVYHDEDTAFHLFKENKFFQKFIDETPSVNKYSLLAVRKDAEKSHLPEIIKKNFNNYDIICDPILWNRSISKYRPISFFYPFLKMSLPRWARIHLKASKITTNRLHSAILGTIIGKETEIFSGSYHKNKSVWEYSLKKRGVKWIE